MQNTRVSASRPSKQTVANPTVKGVLDLCDISEYMMYLSPSLWSQLYRSSIVVAAVYRSLPIVDRTIVLRLAFMKQPVSERLIRLWMQPNSEVLVKKAISSLRCKNVIVLKATEADKSGKPSQGEVVQYLLHDEVQRNLQQLILSGPSLRDCPFLGDPNDCRHAQRPSLQELQKHSQQKWDFLLRWMMRGHMNPDDENRAKSDLGTGDSGIGIMTEKPCDDLIQILIRRNLVTQSSAKSGIKGGMSREAFTWLLKDLQSQISSLVVEFLFMMDDGIFTQVAEEARIRTQKAVKQNVVLTSAERQKAEDDLQNVLAMILSLSQSSIGQVFPLSVLTASQRRFLAVAVDLGAVWRPPGNKKYFVVAPYSLLLGFQTNETNYLTAALSSLSVHTAKKRGNTGLNISAKQLSLPPHYIHPSLQDRSQNEESTDRMDDTSTSRKNEGYSSGPLADSGKSSLTLEAGIVVQSNFKVYVYTASALQVSILGHLCELQSRTPNLVVGLLTRESVLAAYRTGITAEQIINFLNAHAHPALHESRTREAKPFIPENVAMQLRMWDQERHRMKLQRAAIFKKWDQQFMPELYQRCVRYCMNKGFLLYYTPWPDNTNAAAFADWLKTEKYLAISDDARDEAIQEIRDLKEQLAATESRTM